MFFQVTQEGKPLRKRRYLFTECFGVIALAAWARISGDSTAADQARALFALVLRYLETPGALPSKVDPRNRPMKGLCIPMILLATAQEFRTLLNEDVTDTAETCVREIVDTFVRPELECVLETVGPRGEVLDAHFEGRQLNPGHAIEAAWFLMREGTETGRPDLIAIAMDMIDWMWKRGWDEECGGLFYFRDLHDRPVQEYWHDMKFWWPHNEAIIATLMAYQLSGEPRFASRHRLVHDWAHDHFADPVHGEWFGYLHRDGRLSVPLKGNLWKGPFHLPRMQLVCWELTEALLEKGSDPNA